MTRRVTVEKFDPASTQDLSLSLCLLVPDGSTNIGYTYKPSTPQNHLRELRQTIKELHIYEP
jgi:hypothetical protein